VHVRDVLRHVREVPVLAHSMVQSAFLGALLAPLSQLLPAVAAQLRPGPHVLGLLTCALSVGSALVAWRLSMLKRRLDGDRLEHRILIVATAFLIGLGSAGLVLRPPWLGVPAIACIGVLGLMLAMAKSVRVALIQVSADPEMEGGVLAVLGAVFAVSITGGGLLLAAAADQFGVFPVLLAAGIVVGGYTVWVIRSSDRSPAASGEASTPVDPAVVAGVGRAFPAHR
jgi:hypothetical protein